MEGDWYVITSIQILADYEFFFSSRRRHTRLTCDWSSDVCSSDLHLPGGRGHAQPDGAGHHEEYELDRADRGRTGGESSGMKDDRDQKADHRRSEERRVGKECRSRWRPY